MWTNSKWMRIWSVIYPVGMYFVVSNMAMFVLTLFLPAKSETYILRHIIVTLVTFPVVYSFYHKPQEKQRIKILPSVTALIAGASLGVALNNIIALTPLISVSETYQNVSRAFFGSTLPLELLAICVLTPALEELLYRGIAYQRLREWLGVLPSILWSAFLFGLMHANLVQFVYAGLIGILLAWLMEKYGLAAAVSAHIGANLISVLRSEILFFPSARESMGAYLGQTGVSFAVCIICVWRLYRGDRKE